MLSARRLAILAVLMGITILLAVARAVQVQVLDSPRYVAQANYQQTQTRYTQSPRGAIFDRSGNLLAISNRAYIVRADVRTLTDTMAVSTALAPALGQSVEDVRRNLDAIVVDGNSVTPTLSTIVAFDLSPRVTNQLTETLKQMKRGGLLIDETWGRDYPQGMIAGPTLGFVSLQPTGYSGVEGFYNSELSAATGQRTERSRMDVLAITPTASGSDVVLTLDLTLQSYVEDRLAQAIQDTGAPSGTIIVMESKTGAILAAASYPSYDPNRALQMASDGQIGLLKDRAVSELYEPGSVIKVATMAIALEAGQITTSTWMTDTGRLIVDGKRIYNSDRSRHGIVDMEDILAKSLNVPTAQIALDMGADAFYNRFRLFGFGSRSGIDLGDEASGVLRTPSDVQWSRTDLATNSYGQGMSATPFQVINALNVIANDGVLMQPYIVKEWREPNGRVITRQPVPKGRVVSPATALELRKVMAIATRRGTPKALIKGYTVAGKTGTADWYSQGIKQDTTIVTYVGFVPAEDPKITVLVKLDQPASSRWAAETTVPIFHDVAERACQIMGVPPDVLK
jgi:cell division protein FtsI/penicillin-binding protein 2